MRIKALMTRDTKEFVKIEDYGGKYEAWTCSLPFCHPETARWEDLVAYFGQHFPDIDINQYELVEFELKQIDKDEKITHLWKVVFTLAVQSTEQTKSGLDRIREKLGKVIELPYQPTVDMVFCPTKFGKMYDFEDQDYDFFAEFDYIFEVESIFMHPAYLEVILRSDGGAEEDMGLPN